MVSVCRTANAYSQPIIRLMIRPHGKSHVAICRDSEFVPLSSWGGSYPRDAPARCPIIRLAEPIPSRMAAWKIDAWSFPSGTCWAVNFFITAWFLLILWSDEKNRVNMDTVYMLRFYVFLFKATLKVFTLSLKRCKQSVPQMEDIHVQPVQRWCWRFVNIDHMDRYHTHTGIGLIDCWGLQRMISITLPVTLTIDTDSVNLASGLERPWPLRLWRRLCHGNESTWLSSSKLSYREMEPFIEKTMQAAVVIAS